MVPSLCLFDGCCLMPSVLTHQEASALKSSCEADLAEALPALEAAIAALKSLSKGDIVEVRAYIFACHTLVPEVRHILFADVSVPQCRLHGTRTSAGRNATPARSALGCADLRDERTQTCHVAFVA